MSVKITDHIQAWWSRIPCRSNFFFYYNFFFFIITVTTKSPTKHDLVVFLFGFYHHITVTNDMSIHLKKLYTRYSYYNKTYRYRELFNHLLVANCHSKLLRLQKYEYFGIHMTLFSKMYENRKI